jgi:hypothetical protein
VTVERNAFLDIKSTMSTRKNMLTKLKVPYVVHNGNLVVIGQVGLRARQHLLASETRRPMKRWSDLAQTTSTRCR